MLKQFALITTLIALSEAAAAQTPTISIPASPTVAPASSAAPAVSNPTEPASADACTLPDLADSVGLNDVPGSDLVTVPVEINSKPVQFLLDVSTAATEVSRATVDALNLTDERKLTEVFQAGPSTQDYRGDQIKRDFTLGATIQATFVNVKNARDPDEDRARVNITSFKMGNATGHNLQFVVAADNEIAKSAPYGGLMTGSFFKQYDVELDFYGNKLNYLTPTTCTDPDQVVFWPHKEVAIISMTMAGRKMEVPVEIGGHEINAVLDTSSPRTIMRRDIAENMLNLKAGSPQMPPAGDLRDGDDMQIYNASLSKITFAGGVTAFNVPALIQTNSMVHNLHKEAILGSKAQFKTDPRIPALTLGMDVLRQLHLYIVYGQGKIYMTSAQ